MINLKAAKALGRATAGLLSFADELINENSKEGFHCTACRRALRVSLCKRIGARRPSPMSSAIQRRPCFATPRLGCFDQDARWRTGEWCRSSSSRAGASGLDNFRRRRTDDDTPPGAPRGQTSGRDAEQPYSSRELRRQITYTTQRRRSAAIA